MDVTTCSAYGWQMATWEEVRCMALALPEASERLSRNLRQWRVREKLFVWERPLRQADLTALGSGAPEGPILGARVEHLGAKEALIADNPRVFFTTPHFDGYAAILVRLDQVDRDELHEVLVEAWLARAPKRLAKAYTSMATEGRQPSISLDQRSSAAANSCIPAPNDSAGA